MRKFSVALVDDHLEEINLLKQVIALDKRFRIAGEFHTAQQLYTYLSDHAIDLLFTDIHMPDLDGFSMIDALEQPPKLVFVSSYPRMPWIVLTINPSTF